VRHIPEWLPWFSYKPLARGYHDLAEVLKNDPMQFVRENMVSSYCPSSMTESAHHTSGS
jgi:hypothetical protein